jgi:hypothetical protein
MAKRKSNAGRPKKKISAKAVRKLAGLQCSYAEMAAVLGCDMSTLTRNFAQVIREGRKNGTMSLKRAQFKKAVDDGNAPMLIWLGKQYLGQTEKSEVKQETKATIAFDKFNVEFGDGTPNDT